jgi:hypothetical protein
MARRAARLARKLDPDLFVGLEYYADFGEIGRFGKRSDQQHTLFALTDFKLGVFSVNFGLGYGLTPAPIVLSSRRSWDTHFRCPRGSSGSSGRATASGPVNPMSRSAARLAQP